MHEARPIRHRVEAVSYVKERVNDVVAFGGVRSRRFLVG